MYLKILLCQLLDAAALAVSPAFFINEEEGHDAQGPDPDEAEPGEVLIPPQEEPEIQGGTLETDAGKIAVSGEAMQKAQAGDDTQARKEIAEQSRAAADIDIAQAGPDYFRQVTIREAALLLENVIAYKMQEANKHPGTFEKMVLDCQEFRNAAHDHPLMDKRS